MLGRHFLEHALPQAARMGHSIRLVAQQNPTSRRAVQLLIIRAIVEGITDNALDTFTRVDVLLNRDFIRSSLLEHSSEIAINALGIFANYHEIEILRLNVFERAESRIEQTRVPDVGVFVHLAAPP